MTIAIKLKSRDYGIIPSYVKYYNYQKMSYYKQMFQICQKLILVLTTSLLIA